MRLQPGQMAPDFDVIDVHGRRQVLNALKGRKVMVSFYRYSGCPFCNLRVAELIRNAAALETRGLVMVSFWQSAQEEILAHVGQQQPPFAMIADPAKRIYRQYGIENHRLAPWKALLEPALAIKAIRSPYMKLGGTGELDLVPADFLLNPDLSIHAAFYGRHVGDHIPLDRVFGFL